MPDAIHAPGQASGHALGELAGIERPTAGASGNAMFGSDAVADALSALKLPYIALTPGASFRGLHDSLVNHLGNQQPQMLLCLHEEAAVALAHGWAKVTGKPLAVAVHSNVGLFHATMAIFNAWCDRMPMLIIGATGPMDAARRRPWIDWIHTARDQGAIVRNYVKWDDQPASPGAAREALFRATWLSTTAPRAPVYVNLDAEMQEAAMTEPLPPLDPSRFMPVVPAAAPAEAVAQAIALLSGAARPLIMLGRVSRDEAAWDTRVALAEALGARVITDLKLGAAFPTDHKLHAGAPAVFPVPEAARAVAEADVILSLDWVDLAGTLRSACGTAMPVARIIQVSLDHHLHNGWSMDHQGLPPVDLFVAADPDVAARAMLAVLRPDDARSEHQPALRAPAAATSEAARGAAVGAPADGLISVTQMGRMLRHVVGERPVSLLHLPLSWDSTIWPFRHPLDFIGSDGGGGVGGGPGIAVGAALALRGSGRLAIAICGDGDFLMGVTALWTAAHYHVPLLIVVANNRSFFNDEVHQERMARMRGRPVENKWIGQRISDPDIDMAQLARAQGAQGFGPVTEAAAMGEAFQQAIAVVEGGGVAVVDVRVTPGYTPAMASALAPGTNRT
jgi:thiamine pyrophosphate-dependent acetolactate synthase large subunit-like protein